MAAPEVRVRTNEPSRRRIGRRLGELWASREILANLARKELRVKYKSTALGVAWSMLNPLLYLVVFYVVFTVFLRNSLPDFPIYLLSGLVPFTLFSASLSASTVSVVSGGSLVQKISFPHEMLPLATVRANTVNFFFQLAVLVAYLLLFGYPFFHRSLLLVPLALVVLLLFTTALGLGAATLNVRYRDTSYVVDLALLMWFWGTPIVYPGARVLDEFGPVGDTIYLLNPVANVVLAFQRAFYGPTSSEALSSLPDPGIWWYAFRLLVVGAASLVLLLLTWRLFVRRSGDFAEEL